MVTQKKNTSQPEKNPFVSLGLILACSYLAIVFFFVVFASDQLSYIVPIGWSLVFLGFILGLFTYLSLRPKKRKNQE